MRTGFSAAARRAEFSIARRTRLLEGLRQLQGFEAPANSWERQILARRIANYDPKDLDQLCLTGAVGWAASLRIRNIGIADRRQAPRGASSVAPITFFARDESEWMISQREKRHR